MFPMSPVEVRHLVKVSNTHLSLMCAFLLKSGTW